MTRRRPTHERSQALHRILAILRNGDRTARELSDRGHVANTTLTKTAQVRMCGNSVCPPLATALVAGEIRGAGGV